MSYGRDYHRGTLQSTPTPRVCVSIYRPSELFFEVAGTPSSMIVKTLIRISPPPHYIHLCYTISGPYISAVSGWWNMIVRLGQ